MLSPKSHALEHLYEAATHAGKIKSVHAGVYEASHEQFKAVYVLSSQRKRSAMNDVVAVQNRKDPGPFNTFLNLYRSKIRIIRSTRET